MSEKRQAQKNSKMSFFRNAFEGLLSRRPTIEGARSSIGALRNLFDPRNIPFFFDLSEQATFKPKREIDLSKITTDEQARTAIDSIIGIDDEARREADAIDFYRNRGGFSRRLEILTSGLVPAETAPLQGLPFTIDGDARLATKDFTFDPLFVLDQGIAEQLEDPAIFQQYLRQTSPQEFLPYLIERDANIVGKD